MGTRRLRALPPAAHGDHPHAYGDKSIIFSGNACFVGSSPRVWGQAQLLHRLPAMLRIIPTRMGTSIVTSQKQVRRKDHPHAYGDKVSDDTRELYMTGSSPRVWGQVITAQWVLIKLGIIPTRMGTSS